jgi:ankyrin repeat protein
MSDVVVPLAIASIHQNESTPIPPAHTNMIISVREYTTAQTDLYVVLSLITEFGCDPNVKGQFGRSPLHIACKGGDVILIQSLLPVSSVLCMDDHFMHALAMTMCSV